MQTLLLASKAEHLIKFSQHNFKVIMLKGFFNKKINIVLFSVLLSLCILVTATTVVSVPLHSEETEAMSYVSGINPKYRDESKAGEIVLGATIAGKDASQETAENSKNEADKEDETKATATEEETTQEITIPFATAIPPETPADYEAQWAAGYLIAIDNPDTTYECAKVTLTDEDRDLLERLCMGEFGNGGFIATCLIAQSVKDAMCFDGYKSVQEVIDSCYYTGSTRIGKNDDCVNAVKYIFDENHDAVQHRLMYMYNPKLCQSAFHESQNYILTYQDVRFFDRWGY